MLAAVAVLELASVAEIRVAAAAGVACWADQRWGRSSRSSVGNS